MRGKNSSTVLLRVCLRECLISRSQFAGTKKCSAYIIGGESDCIFDDSRS
jgi:hypothetical protein